MPCWNGPRTAHNRGTPRPFQIAANGIWTWFSDARAITRNGATYFIAITSAGTVLAHKYVHATHATTSFQLSSTGMEIDDHDNGSIKFLPDGRLIAFYCKHADTGQRYRISTSSEDISSWDAEAVVTASGTSYSNLHYLSSNGRLYNHFRAVDLTRISAASPFTSWDAPVVWIAGQNRVYTKSCNNGTDRIDFLFTNCHPSENPSSVYHGYMQLDAGVEKLYKSDGTYVGTSSVTPATFTRIYDGTTTDAWVWDITYGSDGHPRVLFVKFPTTSDHRYMFSRWTGSAWTTPVEIVAGGANLLATEVNYSGGLCFDQADPNRVYASVQVSGQWELQEFRTADSGATWSKYRDITSGSSVRNCRPISPRDATDVRCIWWSGTYTSFTNYSTELKATG